MSKAVTDQIYRLITPSVIGILGLFIWRDLSEVRSDVKLLLTTATENRSRIESLEKEVGFIRDKYMHMPSQEKPERLPASYSFTDTILFHHEPKKLFDSKAVAFKERV